MLFFVVKLLEESGYDGPRHFDAHAYRTESVDGVWDFARGCMRTYLILKDKAQRFAADREIQALLAEIRAGLAGGCGVAAAVHARRPRTPSSAHQFDRGQLASRARNYERLDQLVIDLLLVVR